MRRFKNKNVDLKEYYTIFLEIGLIGSLLIFLVATKVDLRYRAQEIEYTEGQEVVSMEDITQTKQMESAPPPPRPPVPVPVPNDEVISDEILDINAEFDLDERLDIPEPPPQSDDTTGEESDENFFVVVEQMPKLKGGLAELQSQIEYPALARKANIEGRVVIQFIINELGKVENPKVVRGIGGGCDEEALRVVSQAEFIPGRQRGEPVRVQYSVPVFFKLQK